MASADVETGRVPDVISGRHRAQKEHRTRRYSRKTSEESEGSPRANIPPPMEQRRRSRPEGIRNLIHRRQQAALRRSSESALLPPIRVSALHQAGGSPTHDANETSSPTSNLTFPAAGMAVEDEPASGPPTGSTHLMPVPEREPGSPLNRKDTLSAERTSDTCLSPTANSDQIRLRAERRMLKSVNDTMNELTVPKSPTAPVMETSIPTPRQNVRGKANRRVSMQSLPKLSATEEPFSIRRKIEQFRKWHEEQYTEKLKKLKVDVDKEKREVADITSPPPQTQPPEIDFTKLLEDNMKSPRPGDIHFKHDSNADQVTSTKPSAVVTSRKVPRCKSGATWRTWRDVNDSYAYTDVAKYIEENELLPADRVQWINDWIGEVEKALRETPDNWSGPDDLTIDLRGLP